MEQQKREREEVYVDPMSPAEEQINVIKDVVTKMKVRKVSAQSHYTQIPGTYGYTEVAMIFVETKKKFITIQFPEANVMVSAFVDHMGFTLDYHRNYGGTEVYVFVKHRKNKKE